MKNLRWGAAGVMIAALLFCPALVSAEKVSMPELREQTRAMKRWTKEYEAHGRTIEVDVPIIVPDVETCPIVEVSPIAPKGIEKKPGETLDICEHHNSPTSIAMKHRLKSPAYSECMTVYPHEIDPESIFAQDNSLSLSDACRVLQSALDCYYEDVSFAVDYLVVKPRTFKGGKLSDAYPSGVYWIWFDQTVSGIPVYASAYQLYASEAIGEEFKERMQLFSALTDMKWFAEIMNEDSWLLRTLMVEPKKMVKEDVQLSPLDTVLASLEAEIEAGRLRAVHALRLGYVCYLGKQSPETFTLVPTWIRDAEIVETSETMGSSEYYQKELARLEDYQADFRNGVGVATLGVNAVTGEYMDYFNPGIEELSVSEEWL